MLNIQGKSTALPIVKKYLNCLNLQIEAPSYYYLERICSSHLNTFPFENISKLLFFRDGVGLPSFEHFVRNYSLYNFGGTCFALNSNLYILLKELGFNCYLVMLGQEHMAIIVVIDQTKYYVDCGAAAPFFKPVNFVNNHANATEFGTDRINIVPLEPVGHIYEFVRFNNGEPSGKPWRFNSIKENQIKDFNDVILKSSKIGATFMNILRCQICQSDKTRSVSLVNNKLTIRHADGNNETRTLYTAEEIERVIKEEFQLLKLPIKEAIEILIKLNIDIFAETQ
jgi:N-hydroxyarylamine O-acetyltransferase